MEGNQLCSIPKYQRLPCAMAVQYPWVPRGPPSSTASLGTPGVTPCRRGPSLQLSMGARGC